MKKLFVTFAVLALSIANAKTYNVKLFQPSLVNGTELSPGEYKVDFTGDKVTIRNGKESAEAPARAETADKKFDQTTVRYKNGDGKYRLTEIRLGGTKTTLVLN